MYSTIEDFFFTASKPIECNTDTVVSFFNCFTFDDVEYEAVFGINIKAARFFERLDNIEVRDATPEEKRQLNLQKSTDKVVVIPRKEVDVYSAFESAVRRINTFLSFHRINQHDSKLFITPKAVVYVKDDEGNLKDGTPIRTSNGSSMPYRDIIIENLHYYVDVLIDTLIEYYNIGITTHTSIYKNILNEQANYYVALGTPLSKKAKATVIQLTADNALEMIFNEYSGNPIKKAIDHALEKNRSEQHNSDEQLTEVEAEYEHKELLPVGN